jgi:hypothetical protein
MIKHNKDMILCVTLFVRENWYPVLRVIWSVAEQGTEKNDSAYGG